MTVLALVLIEVRALFEHRLLGGSGRDERCKGQEKPEEQEKV
jgi:hypothetical protein